jgi:alpha-mannosidase
MNKPAVHLICNAHLDPVWQWRWEEGAAEALATFRTAVRLLREHQGFIFNHNEAVLYQWVERLDPPLFRKIQDLAARGRWAVSGGWFLQPDLNLPGTESIVRHIAEGRRYFKERFRSRPRVAYNFDSFGHGGGLPQILRRAGYEMYIHMRPQAAELALPADLYRWRGVDGTEILAYRISVGLYHTERDNIRSRLEEGVELALRLGRDVPVFWGLGDHGGGATREDLKTIDAFIAREQRVRVLHSTPDKLYAAIKDAATGAPVFEGDLQRVFTGCYTSLSRVKRRAVRSLARLVQSETLAAWAWWRKGDAFPEPELRGAWRDHLFNDFHDVITGSCTEPAEQDALDIYGRAAETARRVRLAAAAALNRGDRESPSLPVTVLNTNAALKRVPVEVESMVDYRPLWTGEWHLKLMRTDGSEVPCQEEQPESLLPFNDWRRKVVFMDDLPGAGVARYHILAVSGARAEAKGAVKPGVKFKLDRRRGLVVSLQTPSGGECLAGPLLEPVVVEDKADSWGTGQGRYGEVAGRFRIRGASRTVARGPVRTVVQSVLVHKRSTATVETCSYPGWPALEIRMRVQWNEERKRLKLRLPTAIANGGLLCEVPAGAIVRPGDGEEHVHGRWCLIRGQAAGRPAALGVASNGLHGLDFDGRELRLSVLRSAAYCHERGFDLEGPAARKFSDLGAHEVRLIVAAGEPDAVLRMLPGLADHLAAPPLAYSHLPFGEGTAAVDEFLSVRPSNIRLLACKKAWEGEALVLRLQEACGVETAAEIDLRAPKAEMRFAFRPFEIKTLRVEKLSGSWREAALIEET